MAGGKDPAFPTSGGGPCAKRTVTATLVALSGQRFVGTNHCMRPQTKCPRVGMPRYSGYVMCRVICDQPAHAEVNAINLAGEAAARGATMLIDGIDHVCDDCMRIMRAAGIARLIVDGVEQDI